MSESSGEDVSSRGSSDFQSDTDDDNFDVEGECFSELFNTSPDSDGETEAVAVGGGVEQAEELVKKLKDELAAKRRITSANKGHTQDVSGKNHRRGIAPKWKRMAKKLRDERMTFSQIQERVYLRSSGTAFLQSSNQLKRWEAKEYPRGRQGVRDRSAKPDGDATSKALAQWFAEKYGARLNNVVGVYVNFDEIPFSYSGQMSGGHTLDYRCANNVMTSEDPAWNKRCCSFIPCLCIVERALGHSKLPCCLLLRRSAKSKWVLSNPMNWLISETGSGVVNTQFIAKTFLPWLNDAVKKIG